jgi:hypothetical protein
MREASNNINKKIKYGLKYCFAHVKNINLKISCGTGIKTINMLYLVFNHEDMHRTYHQSLMFIAVNIEIGLLLTFKLIYKLLITNRSLFFL